MFQLPERIREQLAEWLVFVKWLLLACLTGIIVGLVVAALYVGVDAVTRLRGEHPGVIWLLPLMGAGILMLYRLCGMEKDRGTNVVLMAVQDAEHIKRRTAPLIFLSAVGTHLVGGSAGRMGAALQLGGSLSACLGRAFRLDEKDRRIVVMCGMAAAFATLFGTPLTAAVFAMEVASVGIMHYSAIVPCLISSYTATLVAYALGIYTVRGYPVYGTLELGALPILQTTVLGVMCALLSILFCISIRHIPRLCQKYLPNPLIRPAAVGALVLVLMLLVGDQTYCGSGDAVIRRLLAGETIPEAFALKILFTALTLGAGLRGGEITPAMLTGCSFCTWVGPMLGLPHSFSGALGMVAVFCGVTNCPLSAILLAFEMFGSDGLPLYALCCGVSYMLSGYYGLYSEQKIVHSKFRTEQIDRKAG